jgi:hypothetical protein
MRSPCCLCACDSHPYQLLNASTNLYEIWYVYIMAPEPISTACFINPSHQPVRLCMLLGNG